MVASKAKEISSPFLAPRRSSSYSGVSISSNDILETSMTSINVEPEHKSTLIGCTANLITAIVGAGIIGIPFAMRETGLLTGWILILVSGILGSKSLRLLVETAKHVDSASYEILCETVFGRAGWVLCNGMMFCMSWGPMLSYLMLVKDTLGQLLGYDGKICLVVASMCVMLPLSLQRDMADLAKTSRLSVLFNIGLVSIIAIYSPTSESIETEGGFSSILEQSTFRPRTLAIGLGIISFAFSCQHSSLIIAGSLHNPTRQRWSRVSWAALFFCSVLSIIMGTFGYVGFLEKVQGNILKNFSMPYESNSVADLAAARAGNVARALLCGTMCFVYPLESFVCRHVIMTNLFQGRDAHEGDDHAVLDRLDRRVSVTVLLYLSALIPALYYDDVGIVLALSGTVAATTLTYIGPGLLFIGVHGQEFIDLVNTLWDIDYDDIDSTHWNIQSFLWYILFMPVWVKFADTGKKGVSYTLAKRDMQTPCDAHLRLGKVRHKRDIIAKQKQRRSEDKLLSDDDELENESPQKSIESKASAELGLITSTFSEDSNQNYGAISSSVFHEMVEDEGEDDIQDEKQTATDFLVAIAFVIFGLIAFISGLISICKSG